MLVARGILASSVLAAVAGIGVVPVFEAGETRRIEDCAANATVLFTCVDARFALNARRLAESVRAVGEFPAVLAVVQGDAFLDALPRALALPCSESAGGGARLSRRGGGFRAAGTAGGACSSNGARGAR